MNKSMSGLFEKLYDIRGNNRYVFENSKTGKYYKDFKKSWYTLLNKIDVNEFRFHDLRHTFATNYLLKEGDINTLKEVLGHSDISTTGRYLKTPTEYKRKSMGYFEVPEYLGKDARKKNRKY